MSELNTTTDLPDFSSITTVRSLEADDAPELNQYYTRLSTEGYASAANYLASTTGLRNATFSADKWNQIINGMKEMQEWYNDNGVATYIAKLESTATNVPGRIDDTAPSINTVYSSSKVDELVNLTNKRVQVLNIPPAENSITTSLVPNTTITYTPSKLYIPANATNYAIHMQSLRDNYGYVGDDITENDSITLYFGEDDVISSYGNTVSSSVNAAIRKLTCQTINKDANDVVITISLTTATNNYYVNIWGIEVVKA